VLTGVDVADSAVSSRVGGVPGDSPGGPVGFGSTGGDSIREFIDSLGVARQGSPLASTGVSNAAAAAAGNVGLDAETPPVDGEGTPGFSVNEYSKMGIDWDRYLANDPTYQVLSDAEKIAGIEQFEYSWMKSMISNLGAQQSEILMRERRYREEERQKVEKILKESIQKKKKK